MAQPALVALHSQTAAAALLAIRDGDETVCLSFVSRDPDHASAPGARGRREPLHTTAQGLVFLAHANTGAADQPITGLGSGELQHSLAKIRRQGYAVTVGTLSPETAGLAAPIRDALGTVVAAVGVVTPVETFRPLRLAPPVLAAAEAVSRCVQASRGPDWRLDEQATVAEVLSPPDELILFCGMSIGFEDVTVDYARTGRAPLEEMVTFIED
ncbi:IclR family transcriptional regulator C-terminal domain-containing protein [Streptomyces sp. NPDC057486]|uniref:IclR family transcriptional regulator domain-containing protein n=1 Tax=Streptomyces sp. NPDC057486 TaxID=3346145 RepID=UPI0036984FA6